MIEYIDCSIDVGHSAGVTGSFIFHLFTGLDSNYLQLKMDSKLCVLAVISIFGEWLL